MNFYKRFIGAIQRKTSHLSPTAMGCYDRLLDWYYANERPIPLDPADCWRICGAVTPADQASVSLVLGEFFERTEVGWTQGRAEEELPKAQARIEIARANGKMGGRPPKRKPNENPAGSKTGTQKKPDQEALHTTESSSPTSKKTTTPPPPKGGGFLKFWSAYPDVQRKVARLQCWEKWRSRKLEPMTEQIVAHVEAMKGSAAWTKDKGAFIPSPLVYLNQQRWEGPIESEGQKVDPWSTRPGVEAIAAKHGLPKWDETIPFEDYRERVRAKVNESEETPA